MKMHVLRFALVVVGSFLQWVAIVAASKGEHRIGAYIHGFGTSLIAIGVVL